MPTYSLIVNGGASMPYGVGGEHSPDTPAARAEAVAVIDQLAKDSFRSAARGIVIATVSDPQGVAFYRITLTQESIWLE